MEDADRDATPFLTRIAIVGTTGAGKTTLARKLARGIGIPHVELDAIYWQPDWVGLETHEFQTRTEAALCGDAWVVDGNYTPVRSIVWERAQMLVWLDYGFIPILFRLLKRTVRRAVTREVLWNGNRESWTKIFSRDSIIIWLFRTYRRRRRTYPELFALPEHAHLTIVHLRSQRETDLWLHTLIDAATRKKVVSHA